MEFLNEALQKYVEDHTQEESPLLKQINRQTHAEVMRPRMLSGHLQGRVLAMLSHMIQPQTILEIGTYTGYSAICLAEGLAAGGKLITIDKNDELEERVRAYFEAANLEENITYLLGNAMELIPTLDMSFDLVFIDADKENYPNYLEIVLPKMRKGGVILSDNVLWSGKVTEPVKEKDRVTKILKEYNERLNNHPRLETLMLPIRDGLTLSRVVD